MVSIATLFSGGEGVGCGAKAAGLKHLWGIEYDDDIAGVARMNGFDVLAVDVTQVDPADFERPDALHASPPCPNFSVAKTDRGETENDLALADAVCRFIRTLKPDVFTLENVYLYRKSESFQRILATLHGLGYGWDWWHLNAANYGVPQTRKRLVLVARRDGTRPQHPTATHAPAEDIAPMFDHRKPWVGWYEAIEDLLPTLPESEFAPWQLERLPEELKTMLVDSAGYPDATGARAAVRRERDTPSNVVVANHARRPMRAFLASIGGGGNTSRPITALEKEKPSGTVTANDHRRPSTVPCAFIVDGKNSRTYRNGETVNEPITTRDEENPIWAVQSGHPTTGHFKAFIVNDQSASAGEGVQTRQARDPSPTARAGNLGGNMKADVGRVVQMTPRALARFQSFPDWYELPESKSLACRVIGNAVPPLLYERVILSCL